MKSFKFSIELFTFFSSSKNSWSFPNSSVILIMNSLKSNDFSSISCTSLSVDTTIWSYLGFQSWFYKKILHESAFWFRGWLGGCGRITSSFRRTYSKATCWDVWGICRLFIFTASYVFYLLLYNFSVFHFLSIRWKKFILYSKELTS